MSASDKRVRSMRAPAMLLKETSKICGGDFMDVIAGLSKALDEDKLDKTEETSNKLVTQLCEGLYEESNNGLEQMLSMAMIIVALMSSFMYWNEEFKLQSDMMQLEDELFND